MTSLKWGLLLWFWDIFSLLLCAFVALGIDTPVAASQDSNKTKLKGFLSGDKTSPATKQLPLGGFEPTIYWLSIQYWCFQSCLSVILGFPIEDPCPGIPTLTIPGVPLPCHSDMFKLVHLEPHHTGTPIQDWLEGGLLAFDWKEFLLILVSVATIKIIIPLKYNLAEH